MKRSVLQKYARLLAVSGLNVQSGQSVIISASTENDAFAVLVAEECYRKGASEVRIEWMNQDSERLSYDYRTLESLSKVEKWEIEKLKSRTEKLPCILFLDSDDPTAFEDVDKVKMASARAKRLGRMKKYLDESDGMYQWCIATVPGRKWAKKLFPELSSRAAVERLWQKILFCSRITSDPVEEWKAHDADLKKRCSYLNSLGIDFLHYTSKEGTDLTVGLMEDSVFEGGSEMTIGRRSVSFQPNIPTEECFTTPMKGRAEGIVYSTMPLSYNGILIENFHIRFRNGKAVEWKAQKNEELLGKLLTMDEGASYIGECALVPDSSPVRKSGVVYYNSLLDENATCHIAFGAGYDSAVRGYGELSREELREKGVNDSSIHIDFMVGSPSLCIEAFTRDKRRFKLIENGEWAF